MIDAEITVDFLIQRLEDPETDLWTTFFFKDQKGAEEAWPHFKHDPGQKMRLVKRAHHVYKTFLKEKE